MEEIRNPAWKQLIILLLTSLQRDHRAELQKGSTVVLETTLHRLQETKANGPVDLMKSHEQLTREKGHLRLEVLFYNECFDAALNFRDKVLEISQQLMLTHYFHPEWDLNGVARRLWKYGRDSFSFNFSEETLLLYGKRESSIRLSAAPTFDI